jgi:hypothetical protein
MKQRNQGTFDDRCRTSDTMMSRRLVVGSSGLALLGLLSPSAFSQAQEKAPESQGPVPKPPKQMQERMEQSRAFAERMRNAGSMEERQQIMMEQMAWEHRRGLEDLRDQLGISDKEWPVIKTRIEMVYNLVHPVPQINPGNEAPKTEVEQRSRELREVLRNEGVAADQIKARLTALRTAREKAGQELVKAQQSLRQIMTLRQEAVLVLNGLLD